MFSYKPRLQRVVNPEVAFAPNDANKVTYENSGPGIYNVWLRLEEKENPWLHVQSGEAAREKQKIIFCYPQLSERALSYEENELFANLFDEYDVYLWPGDQKPIDGERPISNKNEFMEKMHLAKSACAAHVVEMLDLQQKSAKSASAPHLQNKPLEGFFIWDDETYEKEIQWRLKREVDVFRNQNDSIRQRSLGAPPDTFDLTQMNLLDERLLEHPNTTSIKVRSPTEEEVRRLRKLFPKLDRVEIVDATEQTYQDQLLWLQGLHVKLYQPQIKKMVLSNQVNLKSLTIEDDLSKLASDCLTEIEDQGARIKQLKASGHFLTKIYNSAKENHIAELSVTVSDRLYIGDELSSFSNMESLHTSGIGGIQEKLPRMPKLKRIVTDAVGSNYPGETLPLDFSDCPALLELSLLCPADTTKLHFPLGKNVKVKFIKETEQVLQAKEEICIQTKEDLAKLTSPDILDKQRLVLDIDMIDIMTKLPHIKEVILVGKNYRNEHKIPPCPNLKSFTLSTTEYPITTLDASALTELQEFVINSNAFTHLNALLLPPPENLTRLSLPTGLLTTLDLSSYSKLEELTLASGDYSGNINVTLPKGAPNLRHLTITTNQTILDLSNYPNLETLKLHGCKNLTKVILPIPNKIRTLSLTNADKLNIDFQQFPLLENLVMMLDENNNSPTDVSHLRHLKTAYIDVFDKKKRTVNFSGCSALQSLTSYSRFPEILSVNLAGCTQLKDLAQTEFLPALQNLQDCEQLRKFKYNASSIPKKLYPSMVEQLTTTLPQLPRTTQRVCKFDIDSRLTTRSNEAKENKMNLTDTMALNHANNASPVARYVSSDSDSVDSETVESKTYKAPVTGKKVVLYTKNKKVNTDLHRIDILDEMTVTYLKDPKGNDVIDPKTGKKIIDKINFIRKKDKQVPLDFKESETLTELAPKWMEEVKTQSNLVLGYWEGVFDDMTPEPLPDLHSLANEKDLLKLVTDPPNAIQVEWSPTQQHCYFVPKPQFVGKNIRILYCAKQNPDYDSQDQLSNVSHEQKIELMPALLKEVLTEKLAPVLKLFDNLSLEEKIQKLSAYCRGFSDTRLATSPTNAVDKLCDTILQRKGSCRHRARAYMTLARLMGIPARMVRSEQHQVGEAPYQNPNGKISWCKLDFGGSESRQDLTAKDVRSNPLYDIEEEVADKLLQKSQTTSIQQTIENQQFIHYYQMFQKLVEKNELKTFEQLRDPDYKLPPLIELTPGQSPLDFDRVMVAKLETEKFDTKNNYFYIHTPEEFKKYLEPLQLKDGEWVRNPNSPFREAMKQGKAVVVINWSTFTPTQIANYMSILENPKFQIIGLTDNTTKNCAAFKSRTTPWFLGKDFFLNQPPQPVLEQKGERQKIEIDLSDRPDWQNEVFGEVINKNGKATLKESELIKLLRKNMQLKQPLEIKFINAPNADANFDLFLHRLQHEHKITYPVHDGVEDPSGVIEVMPGIIVLKERRAYESKLPDHVYINQKDNVARKKIYLHRNKLHECIKQLVVDEKTQENRPGLFEEIDTQQHVFYLTEDITQREWTRLMKQVVQLRQHFPDKSFYFETAPNVQIEGLPSSKNTSKAEKISSIIFTNDTDHLTSQLSSEAKDPLVVEINPRTTFKELIAEIKDTPRFLYEEHGVLTALKSGRQVILNGEMSQSLYQQLLPIFAKEFHFNGGFVPITGNLTVAMPMQARIKFPALECESRMFSLDEYRAEFKQDKKYIDELEMFYRFAHQLPHRGAGRPALPSYSFHHLQQMVTALKEEKAIHKHNPIKHLFHFDYPKKSEEYAHLNVMAKSIFRPTDATPARVDKIQKIWQKFTIHSIDEMKPHVWHLLNCFNGNELRQIVGKDHEHIKYDSGFPVLSEEALKILYENIAKITSQAQPTQPKQDRLNKQLNELDRLINDEHTPVIMLKGPPGVGKTHTIRKVIGKYYDGEKNIIDWLNNKSGGILLLDEANMALPGKWDFLKGLFRPGKKVFYQGKEYFLSNKHKVIGTANPEDFPGRFYHSFFQRYAKTVYFKKPSDNYLNQHILEPMLGKELDEYKKHLLYAYHLIEIYNPFLTTSFRDITDLCFRFMCLVKENPSPDKLKENLLAACVGEYAGSIKNPEDRKKFIADLEKEFGVKVADKKDDVIFVTPSYPLTREKEYLLDAVKQDLLMRRHVKEQKGSAISCKTAVVVEGDPGLGKTELFRAILKGEEYSDARDRTDIGEAFKEAYKKGKPFLWDEYNLDNDKEELRNQILSGDFTPTEVSHHFRLLGTQNPVSMAGRKPLSPAERDRTHFLYMDTYTEKELYALSRALKISSPETFVKAYQKICEEYPQSANMRTFFTLLNAASNKAKENLDAAANVTFQQKTVIAKAPIKPLQSNDPRYNPSKKIR